MFVLAPYSAHPATIIAKIIPNTIITFILSLYLSVILIFTLFRINFLEASGDASQGLITCRG